MAAWSLLPEACRAFNERCSSPTSVRSVASRCRSDSSSTSRSAGRAVSNESPVLVWRTWVAIATPSSRHRIRASAPKTVRPRRRNPRGCNSPIVGFGWCGPSSCRPCWSASSALSAFSASAWGDSAVVSSASGSVSLMSAVYPLRPEESASQRRGVAEDADAQHDDDRRRQLCPDAQLVADVDDQCRDQHVEDERHHEDLRVENPFQVCPQPAEHRVEGGDDRDRQIGLDGLRNAGMKDQAQHDTDGQRCDTDHPCSASATCTFCTTTNQSVWRT